MYDFIKGKIISVNLNQIVLENNGIGYRINMSQNSIREIEEEDGVAKVYTELIVREDSQQLYGFYSVEERDVYNLLTTVSGVGPKIGVGMLSGLSHTTIVKAVLSSDVKTLTTAPGVGKKTAERLILELKDKFEKLSIDLDVEVVEMEIVSDDAEVARDALTSLGYSNYEINRAMKSLDLESLTVEDIIKETLKLLSK